MASKSSKAPPASSGAAAGAVAPPPPANAPTETAVLLVQVEALGADELLRQELRRRHFAITHQALAYLTPESAHEFLTRIADPHSPLHVSSETTTTATTESPRPAGDKPTPSPTPRSARTAVASAPSSLLDAGELERAVRGLTAGPVLVLGLERVGAITELQELVGPTSDEPEAWAQAPQSWRARLGKDRVRVGVRCSAQALTAPNELAFLLQHTQPPRATPASTASTTSTTSRTAADGASTQGDARVDLAQVLAFLFPAHVQHPNSTGRLLVFGLYGPLDARAQLRAGERGLHVVTDRELDAMAHRQEREDILAVYGMCSLSQEDEEAVVAQVDQLLKRFPRHTRRDVEALFAGLARDPDGRLSFHDMQAAIMKERCRRVLCMKERLHPALAPPIQNQFRQTLTRIHKTRDEIAPATMFLKDLGFSGADNATLVTRLLSNHAFEICHLDDANAPALTQNVRLLRERVFVPGDTRPPWNPRCGGGTGHGSAATRKLGSL